MWLAARQDLADPGRPTTREPNMVDPTTDAPGESMCIDEVADERINSQRRPRRGKAQVVESDDDEPADAVDPMETEPEGGTVPDDEGAEDEEDEVSGKTLGAPPLIVAKRAKMKRCNECGAQVDQALKCRGCKELLCSGCALQCRRCERHFCTLHCAGWTIEIPTIEQQKQQEVPETVKALHSSAGALDCKRCLRRLRREETTEKAYETPDASPRRQQAPYETPA